MIDGGTELPMFLAKARELAPEAGPMIGNGQSAPFDTLVKDTVQKS
jgi:hypothetical protein